MFVSTKNSYSTSRLKFTVASGTEDILAEVIQLPLSMLPAVVVLWILNAPAPMLLKKDTHTGRYSWLWITKSVMYTTRMSPLVLPPSDNISLQTTTSSEAPVNSHGVEKIIKNTHLKTSTLHHQVTFSKPQ